MEYIQKFFNKLKQSYANLINWGKQRFTSEPPKKKGRPRKKK